MALVAAACGLGPSIDRATWSPIACTAFRTLDAAAASRDDELLVAAAAEVRGALGDAGWDQGGEIRDALRTAAREAAGTVQAHESGQHALSEQAFESMVRALSRTDRALQAVGLDCGGPPSIGVA